jgi:hypothetical protein
VLEARMDLREMGLKRGEYDVVAIGRDGKVVARARGQAEGHRPRPDRPAAPLRPARALRRKDITLHDGETVFWREKDAEA